MLSENPPALAVGSVNLSFITGVTLWLIYGVMNELISLIVWNGIALILGFCILYAKMKWGRQE